MDFCTINMDEFSKLDVLRLREDRHLGESRGQGCSDPPGFPSYFVQSIFTPCGNHPNNPAEPVTVLDVPGASTRVVRYNVYCKEEGKRYQELLNRLYRKLPFDHPRVQAWVRQLHAYFRDCWLDPAVEEKKRRHVAELAIIPSLDKALDAGYTLLQYRAVDDVRRWYPEYEGDEALIRNPPPWGRGGDGDWWETEAVQPTPETCRPRYSWRKVHPTSQTWCQWCGWVADESEVK